MDIRCVVCGEPYEAWGINHGDMMAWETDLFRAGAGCPCCLGVKNEDYVPDSLADFENGDEDPIDRIFAREDFECGKVAAWAPPANEVLHECDGCGVKLCRILAAEVYDGYSREKVYDWVIEPRTQASISYYRSHRFSILEPSDYIEGGDEEWNWHPWDDDRSACPYCAKRCDECDEVIVATVPELEPGDPCLPGASFLPPGDYTGNICVHCYDGYCSECQYKYNECQCETEEKEDDLEDSTEEGSD